MNWGLWPCWVGSSLDEGVRFVRKFQQLDTLSLVVTMEVGSTEEEFIRSQRLIAASVLKKFELEKGRDQTWLPPKLRVINARRRHKESTIDFPLVRVR